MATEAATTTGLWTMASTDPILPLGLRRAGSDWSTIHAIGNRQVLSAPMVGLICSVQCPGSIVIKTFDAVRELRDAGVAVAGGFHSPMERDCLDFLLRGRQPVVICPAKGLSRPRLPAEWRKAIDAGRLLLATPFDESVRRTTSAQAHRRNQFVAALAAAVFIPHASPGGKTEAIAHEVASTGRSLFTFNDAENHALLRLGATGYDIGRLLEVQSIGPDADNATQMLGNSWRARQ